MPLDHTDPVNVAATRQNATDLADVRCAVPEVGVFRGYSSDVTDALNHVLRIDWDHVGTTAIKLDVYTTFVGCISLLGLHPGRGIDDKTVDFRWAGLRCILSGAGFAAWPEISAAVLKLDPSAPFSPSEGINEWYTALQDAHRSSGMPCTIGCVPFLTLARLTGELNEALIPQWLTVSAAFHVLKHLRITDTHIRAVHHGSAVEITKEDAKKGYVQHLAKLTGVLGFSRPSKSEGSIADLAGWPVAIKLRPENMLHALPLTRVPPDRFSGGWSRLLPGYHGDSDFTETQMRLEGVKGAKDGRVTDFRGDEEVALNYAWNIDALDSATLEAEDRYLRGCPETYPMNLRPFDILHGYAPNITLGWAGEHAEAMKAIYDAFLTLPVLRYYRRSDLADTHPFGWVMPILATNEGSTENGASSIAAAIARTHMPAYPTASQTNDHESAPDNRTLADKIIQYGGLWLDDWKMPTSSGHILSKAKLQTLATGGGIEVGQVLKNGVKSTTLDECFVINTKCVDLPPDLINRSVFFFADKVTAEQKMDTTTAGALKQGRVAIEIRFAATHWVGWLELPMVQAVATSIRFPILAAVAAQFAKHRGVANPVEAVAAAWKFAGEYQQAHYRQAEDSGLVHQVENRRTITARVIDLFSSVSIEMLFAMLGYKLIGKSAFSLSDIAFARCQLTMGERAPVSLSGCLHNLGIPVPLGTKPNIISMAYNEDAKRVMPVVGDEFVVHPGNGTGQWKLERMADNGQTPRFKLIPPESLK